MQKRKKRSYSSTPSSSRQSQQPRDRSAVTTRIIAYFSHNDKIGTTLALLAIMVSLLVCSITSQIQRQEEPAPEPALPVILEELPREDPAPPLPPPDPPRRYELTEEERAIIESVVTAEAGGEPLEGQMAVAQCILNACEYEGIRPEEALQLYQYTRWRPEAVESAREAVAAVFDEGKTVTNRPIMFFYNPDRCRSDWHDTQIHVMTVCCHRFYELRGDTA